MMQTLVVLAMVDPRNIENKASCSGCWNYPATEVLMLTPPVSMYCRVLGGEKNGTKVCVRRPCTKRPFGVGKGSRSWGLTYLEYSCRYAICCLDKPVPRRQLSSRSESTGLHALCITVSCASSTLHERREATISTNDARALTHCCTCPDGGGDAPCGSSSRCTGLAAVMVAAAAAAPGEP